MPKCVLVIEDSQVIQKLLKQVLSLMDIGIVPARDGEAGLSKSRERKFDLIMLDLIMPVMDGQAFIASLRKEKGNPNKDTPILIITGNEQNLKLSDFKGQGVMDIVEKPIDFDHLSTWVEKYFKQKMHAG